MPHKLRKTRKHRGSRTQGWGRIGQHRDAGSRPFRKVGMHKHRWSIAANMEQPYFGKHGFHSPQSIHRKENTINLSKLEEIAQSQTNVNLTELGYTKLLGSGKVSKAFMVTVPAASKTAVAKINTAGGKVTTEEEEQAEEQSE